MNDPTKVHGRGSYGNYGWSQHLFAAVISCSSYDHLWQQAGAESLMAWQHNYNNSLRIDAICVDFSENRFIWLILVTTFTYFTKFCSNSLQFLPHYITLLHRYHVSPELLSCSIVHSSCSTLITSSYSPLFNISVARTMHPARPLFSTSPHFNLSFT